MTPSAGDVAFAPPSSSSSSRTLNLESSSTGPPWKHVVLAGSFVAIRLDRNEDMVPVPPGSLCGFHSRSWSSSWIPCQSIPQST